VVRGNVLARLPEVVAAMPADSSVVVFHTAVLAYLDTAARDDFVELVTDLPVRWISQEGAGVLPTVAARLPEFPDAGENRWPGPVRTAGRSTGFLRQRTWPDGGG
jgi:hypothetical protein